MKPTLASAEWRDQMNARNPEPQCLTWRDKVEDLELKLVAANADLEKLKQGVRLFREYEDAIDYGRDVEAMLKYAEASDIFHQFVGPK